MSSFFQKLFGHWRSPRTPEQGSAARVAHVSGGTAPEVSLPPGDEPAVDPLCAWCEGLVSPDDHYVLPSGEIVHASCRHKELDEKVWLCVRRAMINELRPAYLALDRARDVQDLIFRLFPATGVTLEETFAVLGELESRVRGLKFHDLRVSSDALKAIRQARSEAVQFLHT